MVQAHYENPDKVNSVDVEYDLELYYTSKLRFHCCKMQDSLSYLTSFEIDTIMYCCRQHDAGVMIIGVNLPGVPPSLMIPPNSSNHMIFGHCGKLTTSYDSISILFCHPYSISNYRFRMHKTNVTYLWNKDFCRWSPFAQVRWE